ILRRPAGYSCRHNKARGRVEIAVNRRAGAFNRATQAEEIRAGGLRVGNQTLTRSYVFNRYRDRNTGQRLTSAYRMTGSYIISRACRKRAGVERRAGAQLGAARGCTVPYDFDIG